MQSKKYPYIIILFIVIIVVAFVLWYKITPYSSHITSLPQNSVPEENGVSTSSTLPAPNWESEKKVKIEIISEGTGEMAQEGDLVFVHYTGFLENGEVFDSSIGSGQPFSFTLGKKEVIAGWEQGILGMRVGEKRKLIIPPDLAYGEKGVGGVIPPNAVLIFEVQMVKIQKSKNQ